MVSRWLYTFIFIKELVMDIMQLHYIGLITTCIRNANFCIGSSWNRETNCTIFAVLLGNFWFENKFENIAKNELDFFYIVNEYLWQVHLKYKRLVNYKIGLCLVLTNNSFIFISDDFIDSYTLLRWCQRVLNTGKHSNVNIVDFTSSWKSGLALCALLNTFRPDLM